MPEASDEPLDLDRLTRLAREDPDAFERERRRLVETLISSAPPGQQQRLRGLQWRLDTVRERAGTPLAACLRMSAMMWERITGPGGLLDALAALDGAPSSTPAKSPAAARVLDFPRPEEDPKERQ